MLKVLLSPAKTFRTDKLDCPLLTEPLFPELTAQLRAALAELEAPDWQRQFKVSAKIARENVERMRHPRPEGAALAVFHGAAFRAFGAETLAEKDWLFGQERLMILSAFYGLLRPLDEIQAYRLDPRDKAGDLSAVKLWKPVISQWLQPFETLVLASDEYAELLDLPEAVTIEFIKDGRRVPSMLAKKLRGQLARKIIDARITSRDEVRRLSADNFCYAAESPDGRRWHFIQKER